MRDPFLLPKELPGTKIRFGSVENVDRPKAVSRADLLALAAAPRDVVIGLGGGAGKMGEAYGLDVPTFLANSLGGSRCDSAVLAGGTTVHHRPDPGLCAECDKFRIHCERHPPEKEKPGVMGTLAELHKMGAPASTLGIVPAINGPSHYGPHILVEDEEADPYYTVVDKRCPVCLILYHTTDDPELSWWEERMAVLQYMNILRNEAKKRSLHVFFNGGEEITGREIKFVANLHNEANPWWVLLVEDSGREAARYAADESFMAASPWVRKCTQVQLATAVYKMGFAPLPSTPLVEWEFNRP